MIASTVNPEVEPIDPSELKLRMTVRPGGDVICLAFVEYRGRPRADAEVLTVNGTPDDDDLVQHVLDFDVVNTPEAGQKWFEQVRVTQPWIKRN